MLKQILFTDVQIQDEFWKRRINKNTDVTLSYDQKKCEDTGRYDNFRIASGKIKGEFRGIRYDDSDVFKLLEGMCYTYQQTNSTVLKKDIDSLVEIISSAQEDDGYLFTHRTINGENVEKDAGDTRWAYLQHSHELYNVGHLYEAAVAHYYATNETSLLDVAVKNADLICKEFNINGRRDVPGHQEIELGLLRLYQITRNDRYLETAKFFLNERGRYISRKSYGEYAQDHVPVTEQREAVGHAVRALYMYAAMTDIAILSADESYIHAVDAIWENIVNKKMYISGGTGACHDGEAFGDNYELPNLTAYSETCAAIAFTFWNYRLFLLHRDGKYMDILERVLYNGLISGVSFTGDRFFYPNPLEADGQFKFNIGTLERQPWFETSCCPVNIARYLPSLPGYIYAQDEQNIFINLYISSKAIFSIDNIEITVNQSSNYPWDGKISINIQSKEEKIFTLKLRLPSWSVGKAVPGDLYSFVEQNNDVPKLRINGNEEALSSVNGYVSIKRLWRDGDSIELFLPMDVNCVSSHPDIEENRGKVALQRGPLLYCIEEEDHKDNFDEISINKGMQWQAEQWEISGNSMLRLSCKGIFAIPYFSWNHRGKGKMKVWIPYDI